MKIFYRLALLTIIALGMVDNAVSRTITVTTTGDFAPAIGGPDDPGKILQSNNPQTGSQKILQGEIPQGLSGSEWSSIQTQITEGKYRAYAQKDGGFVSANPAHGWNINYGADGSTRLTPRDRDSDSYHIGLKLNAIGYGNPKPLQSPPQISTDKTTVTYHWNPQLREIWLNSKQRLEQWFVLEQRPVGVQANQPLTVEMALQTNLIAKQNADSISFNSPAGTHITYDKLKVWDKQGRKLPASMQLLDNILTLQIDDAQAIYPLTIDPSFQQQAYIKASNTDIDDVFGSSVALSYDTLVVTAPFEASSVEGVNGNQFNNNLKPKSGAVYVFTRSGTSWSQQAYIKASNTGTGDEFGTSVALSGSYLVVGAKEEDSNATGVNGDQSNDLATNSGAVYVFYRSGTSWTQTSYIKASNSDTADRFGGSVAISVNALTLVVGAPNEDSLGVYSGAVYVFSRVFVFGSGWAWVEQIHMHADNAWSGDKFGTAVAFSGNTLVVGASAEDSNATGVNGNPYNDIRNNSGAVYVYYRSGSTWSQQAYIKASNTDVGDEFGTAVAIFGDTLVVTAPFEDSDATDINGDQSNNLSTDSGAVYIFTRNGTTWSQQAYLKASNTEAQDTFGTSIALSGNYLAVGASNESSNATGVNGNQSNNSALSSGAVYFFTRSDTTWSQQDYIKSSNTDAYDRFGNAVALSGDTLVVGAVSEDSNATGVNGSQGNNSASSSGAVYVFDINACSGDNATLQGTFVSGTKTSCRAALSITTGNPLVVQAGAILDLVSPQIYVGNGFSAALRSRVSMGAETSAATASIAVAVFDSTQLQLPSTKTSDFNYVQPSAPVSVMGLSHEQLPLALQAVLQDHDVKLNEAVSDSLGQTILFATEAALVAWDGNGYSDIYLYNTVQDHLLLVSQTPEGIAANGPSDYPVMDGYAKRILFQSLASNLITGDDNGVSDIFLFETDNQYLEHLTAGSTRASSHPSMDASGELLFFDQVSEAGYRQIYGFDWANHYGPDQFNLDQRQKDNHHPAVSGDGRYLVYLSIDADAPENLCQIELLDWETPITEQILCPEILHQEQEQVMPFFSEEELQLQWYLPGSDVPVYQISY